jgi:aldose 1-epimerase
VITLDAGPAQVKVIPEAGGRVGSPRVHGEQLLVTNERAIEALGAEPGPFGWGIFPMAPWAGRIRRGRFSFQGKEYKLPVNFPPHAIHGTLAERAADGAEVGGSVAAALTWILGPPWPFAGRVLQSVALAEDSLTLALTIHADDAMPVTCGWHPWWSRQLSDGSTVELDFRPEAMYLRDEEGIPTGALVPSSSGPWDDCFPLPASPIILRWPGVLEIALETDCQEVVVFTERPYGVCVEPQTGPPDAVNLGIHCATLARGDRFTARARWTWRQLH